MNTPKKPDEEGFWNGWWNRKPHAAWWPNSGWQVRKKKATKPLVQLEASRRAYSRKRAANPCTACGLLISYRHRCPREGLRREIQANENPAIVVVRSPGSITRGVVRTHRRVRVGGRVLTPTG